MLNNDVLALQIGIRGASIFSPFAIELSQLTHNFDTLIYLLVTFDVAQRLLHTLMLAELLAKALFQTIQIA
jgi:hypothetical protein